MWGPGGTAAEPEAVAPQAFTSTPPCSMLAPMKTSAMTRRTLAPLLLGALVLLLQPGAAAQSLEYVGDTTQTFQYRGRQVPYRLYVPRPPVQQPPEGYPFFLALHGGGDDHTKFFTGYDNGHLKDVAQELGVVIACPRTKPNTDYRGHEEREVLEVMSDVSFKVLLNPRKLYIFGHSMGGVGALEIAARNPIYFAGAGSIAGPLSTRVADYFENVPVYLAHGAKDEVVPVAKTREFHQALLNQNATVHYHEIPEADHNNHAAEEFEPMLRWLLRHERKVPEREETPPPSSP